jgi:hypothetical protein
LFGKKRIASKHIANDCRILAAAIKLNLYVILIEFLKTLQEVGLENACNLWNMKSLKFIGITGEI